MLVRGNLVWVLKLERHAFCIRILVNNTVPRRSFVKIFWGKLYDSIAKKRVSFLNATNCAQLLELLLAVRHPLVASSARPKGRNVKAAR